MKAYVLFGIALFLVSPTSAQQQNLLDVSIVGAANCDKKPCYSEVMDNLVVQKLMLDLAASPRDSSTVETALKGTGVSAKDLLELGLIRREGERYFLNFALFTAADVRRIREVSDGYAASLAQALLARRAEIDAALQAYDAPGVDRKAVAYFILGCASLDWEGLKLTAGKGYRKIAAAHPDGKYVPHAQEKSQLSLEKIYWGSHTAGAGHVQFTSFGDHSARRYTFPDLLWQVPGRISRTDYPEEAKPAIRSLVSTSLDSAAADIGRIMLALRDGEKSADQVAKTTGLSVDRAQSLLSALSGLDYVTEADGRYRAKIPVFAKKDEASVRRLLAIGNEVMESWLAENYPKMKSDLRDLSFSRSGVPFEDGFTMIWHYVFGIANRKLVEAGFFADPYGAERKFKGSVPAVYELEFELP